MRYFTPAAPVVDSGGKIAYAEYVPEMTDPPDYDAALAALGEAV